MTEEELKNKCTERAKIFQQAMESCHSSSPMDCIEWFADRIADLEKENAGLKKNCEDLKEFYEKEYFEIADKTANERIKELEQNETEITVDDYSPYDENTWGMMHEEIFVPKNLVIDMLKEIYAYIENLKKENAELKDALKGKRCNCMTYLNFKDLEKECAKAKEIIKALLNVFVYDLADDEMDAGHIDTKIKAEQFLNSEVEK